MVVRKVCLWSAFSLLAISARGQSANTAATEDLEQRVKRLEERISRLEQALALAEKRLETTAVPVAAVRTQASETPRTETGRDGFWFKSADGDFQFSTGAYFQVDGRAYTGGGTSQADTFLLRRARPILQGTLYKFIGFRVVPDFGEGKAVLQDAYLDLRYLPKMSVRAGKFKAPFGLERLQSSADLMFAERGLPSDLTPNRDVGIQLGGELAGSRLNYALGLFNGAPDGASVDMDNNSGKDFVARVFGSPFPSAGRFQLLGGLGVGFAVSAGTQEGVLPSFKTSAQSTFFTYASGVTASGERKRYSPQAYYYHGPFGLMAEFVQSNQLVARNGTRSEISNEGWQVAGSYLLTRDHATFKRLTPRQDFDIGRGTWGAWELVARIGRLTIDPDAFTLGLADPATSARRARAWSAGVNWYLNRNVRLMLDYERTSFTGGDRVSEGAILSRFQLLF
jgi:phosphate-selective porin OprO/OprP